jgi:hypothetical protein
MPEEDDDALGQMLGDRIKGTKGDSEDEERDDREEPSSESSAESASGNDTSEAAPQENTESAQITQSTEVPSGEDERQSEAETEEGTVRSRSPFPLYVTPDLKETVQNRFEKFNAQRTLNDEPQVEKHKHFMEGLLRAGLDHPDLEEYVLDEFKDD